MVSAFFATALVAPGTVTLMTTCRVAPVVLKSTTLPVSPPATLVIPGQ